MAVLEVFSEEVKKRQEIGERYSSNLGGREIFGVPMIASDSKSVYAQYTILSADRSKLQEILKSKNIPSVPYYTVPLHLQPVFSSLGYSKCDFPVTENLAEQCLSLPMSPYLTEEDQGEVMETLLEANI